MILAVAIGGLSPKAQRAFGVAGIGAASPNKQAGGRVFRKKCAHHPLLAG